MHNFFTKPLVSLRQSIFADDNVFHSVAKRARVDPSTTADNFMLDGVSDIFHTLFVPPSQQVLKEYSGRLFAARSLCFN